MTTNKQIAANRRNSKRSTGPKTPEGKTICGLNSLRDGLYATTLILPSENKEQFDHIQAKYEALYQPRDAYEEKLVDLLAGAEWKMMRAGRLAAAIYEQYAGEPPDTLSSPYDRATRIEARHERAWCKLSKELQSIRAARTKQAQRQAPSPQPPQSKLDGQPATPKSTPAQDAIKRGWATPEEWSVMTDKERGQTLQERNEIRWVAKKGAEPWMTVRHYRGKVVDEFPPEEGSMPETTPPTEPSTEAVNRAQSKDLPLPT